MLKTLIFTSYMHLLPDHEGWKTRTRRKQRPLGRTVQPRFRGESRASIKLYGLGYLLYIYDPMCGSWFRSNVRSDLCLSAHGYFSCSLNPCNHHTSNLFLRQKCSRIERRLCVNTMHTSFKCETPKPQTVLNCADFTAQTLQTYLCGLAHGPQTNTWWTLLWSYIYIYIHKLNISIKKGT